MHCVTMSGRIYTETNECHFLHVRDIKIEVEETAQAALIYKKENEEYLR